MKKLVIILIIFLSVNFKSNSQTQKIDSLFRFTETYLNHDSIRVKALNNLAIEYQNIDLNKAKNFLEESEKISIEIDYPLGIANSLYIQSFYYWNIGNYDSSLMKCNRALHIFKTLDLSIGQIKCYTRIAVINNNKGNYGTSIEYYYKSLELCEKTGNYKEIGKIYNNIGVTYGELQDFNKALEYNFKALEIKQQLKDTFSIGISINNIGHYNLKAQNYNDAYKYLHQSLKYNGKINNNYVLGITNQNLGNLHDIYGNYDSSYLYHQKGVELLIDYGSQGQLSRSYYLFSNHFLLQENFKKANNFAHKALTIATKTDEKEHILNSYESLYKSYYGLNDLKNAFSYLIEFNLLNDALEKDENIKRIAVQEKELELKVQKEKTDLELSIQRKQKLLILLALIFTAILVILITYILIQKTIKNKQLRKANETRDQMFKIISHDFRSPLISISNTLQLIPELIKEKDYNTAINLSLKDEQSVSRVLTLIDSLITWTLSQNDNIPYNPENYNLFNISNILFDIYTPIANYKRIELINNISKNIQVFADKNILNTVLRNLINNAIKFTPENGKIEVSSKAINNIVEIRVTDTGIGIDKDKLAKIFSLDKEKVIGTKGEKGNGLGLFFCKEFIEKNNGKMGVESKVGEGSSFYCTVPTEK